MNLATIDLSGVTTPITDLSTALLASLGMVIAAGVVVAGMVYSSRSLIRYFKSIADSSGGGETQEHRAFRRDWNTPPTPGSWKGTREGFVVDWNARHPNAGHGEIISHESSHD